MHRKYKSDFYSTVAVFGNVAYSMKVTEGRSNVLSKEQRQLQAHQLLQHGGRTFFDDLCLELLSQKRTKDC